MVGHTGVIRAGIKACELTDFYLGKIVSEVLSDDGTIIITADHGNIEEMINLETGQIDTEHSSNPVPFIILNKALRGRGDTLPSGILSDIAPTVLGLAKISVPSEMIGRNLLA
jgi:2,3-bisphosphoglycerate-independent phosphoglycerate mutase